MATSHLAATRSRPRYDEPIQWAALAVAVIFSAVGVLSFISGVTAHHDQLSVTGHHSQAALFGVLDVSILRNVVHLAFGVVGVVLARTFSGARKYLLAGGLVYLMQFVYGLIIDHDATGPVLPHNDTDNWLHLATAVTMVLLGAVLGLTRRAIDRDSERGARGGATK